jgi:hypothetical protein
MKLFVIGGDIPRRRHGERGVTAVHIVTYELLRELRGLGHELVFQLVFNRFRTSPALSASEQQALAELEAMGVSVLPQEHAPAATEDAGRPARFLRRLQGRTRVEDYYPASRLREQMTVRIRASGADGVLTIWSPEGVAATYGFDECPTIAYQADLDFRPAEVRMRDRALFAVSDDGSTLGGVVKTIRAWRERIWVEGFKRAHLKLMQDVDVIANNMAMNAEFYTRHGHPRSVYLRNFWSDCAVTPPPPRREPVKIIGHAGHLGATGGTYGLRYLLVDVLPRLEEAMGRLAYEVHIFGGGELSPSLRPLARHPRVVLRGFVEDYDGELRSSDVFVMLNNAGPYQGAHTRQIIAWAMGLCLVTHANSRLAIPETRHLENALVGSTPEEIAHAIRAAATDSALNGRLRQGGRATYEQWFRPRLIAEAFSQEFTRLASPAPSKEEAACAATL